MKELLESILTNIVSNKEALNITEELDDYGVVFKVELDEEDKSIVIGSKGKNIKSIRSILSIIAKREGKRVNISIQD